MIFFISTPTVTPEDLQLMLVIIIFIHYMENGSLIQTAQYTLLFIDNPTIHM